MDRFFFFIGSLFAGGAVLAGAFGAHLLQNQLTPEMLAVFETGARYQLFHSLAILVCALAIARWPLRKIRLAGLFFVMGVVLFSGSLYLLAYSGISQFGILTPIGGTCFLIGWFLLAWTAARIPPTNL